MQVYACQFDIAWENPTANFERVRQLLTAAAPMPRALVVLPEMFSTGFSMNTAAVAEPYGGATESFLAELAREFNVFLVGGAAMRANNQRVRNKALVFSPETGLLAHYAKMRLFTPAQEPLHFTPGEQVVLFSWQDWRVAPFVCYDLRFPELFRAAAGRGAHLLLVIANWPTQRLEHWIILLRARATENQAYVVGVNRCGADPHARYAGRSLVINPRGEILADAGEGENVIGADLDLAALEQYRREFPALADMNRAGGDPNPRNGPPQAGSPGADTAPVRMVPKCAAVNACLNSSTLTRGSGRELFG